MNNQRAKEVLLLYRPGTDDPDDPDVAEALELAERDPALGHWFQEQRRLQQSLRARFRQIEPPAGFMEQILSERKVHTAPGFRRRALVLSAAVAVVCLVVGVQLLLRGPHPSDSFATYRNRLPGIALREYPQMDLETSDLGKIHNYLARRGMGDYALPKALEQATGTGCKVLSWNAKDFSMVCFNSGKNNQPGEPDLFLFIIDRHALKGAPATIPTLERPNRRFTTASWSSGNKIYVLGGLGDEQFLRRYL